MIINELISANALLAANVLLLGAAAIELLRLKRVIRRCDKARSNPPVVAATKDVERNALSRLVDQRIVALEKIADTLVRKEQVLQQSVRQNAPHESAVRLARSGASADDLVRACGLNKGEAQLLIRLHARPGGHSS